MYKITVSLLNIYQKLPPKTGTGPEKKYYTGSEWGDRKKCSVRENFGGRANLNQKAEAKK